VVDFRALAVGACALALVACDKFSSLSRAPKGPAPSTKVVRGICASEFGGEAASVRVWRDEKGEIYLLELIPDRQKNALAPTVFYDDRGREQERMTTSPKPSSPTALEAEGKREEITRGTQAAETIPCAADAGAP
jgi:hypothetical protein